MRKPSKKKLRNKADRMLQDYIKAKYKNELCWLCGNNLCSVGHHFIYKSQSNATRFYIPNIIPLCQNCHCLIHAQPSMQNAKISFKMGEEWYKDLEEAKRQGAKFTKEWITNRYEEMQDLLKTQALTKGE